MAKISSFRDLLIYQRARKEAAVIFEVTKTFPREERYSLIDQIRRSSRAVSAMVGEAWGRRRYEAVFVSKLSEALGEAHETQVWLDHAMDAKYLAPDQHAELNAAWQEVGAMLRAMAEKSAQFCGKE